jgi:hypothetical protein
LFGDPVRSSVRVVADRDVSRRGFVLGAAAAVVGGGALLDPLYARAAGTGVAARLVVKTSTSSVGFDFVAVRIISVGGSWRVQLVTGDPKVQKQLEALYQAFVAGTGTLRRAGLLTYNRDGTLKTRYALGGGFPGAVTVFGVSAGSTQLLETRFLWVSRTLKKVA